MRQSPLYAIWKQLCLIEKGRAVCGKPLHTKAYSDYFRKAIIQLTSTVETIRTHPVKRMALVPETWSQSGIDL